MMSCDVYLAQVNKQLRLLASSIRAEILAELQQHIEDSAKETGQPVQTILARMGAPDEVGKALAQANRQRMMREWRWALIPYPVLALAAVMDRLTANNYAFALGTLIVCFGVVFYYFLTRLLDWPFWVASWAGLASMLPAMAVGYGGNLWIFALVFPCAVLRIASEQGLGAVLLVICSMCLVAAMTLLRITAFTLDSATVFAAGVTLIVSLSIAFIKQLISTRSGAQQR